MPGEEKREGESRGKRPVFDSRSGMVRVAVWENSGANGPFPTASFSRLYRDRDDTWKSTSGFDAWDLADVARCAFAAEAYMREHYSVGTDSQARPSSEERRAGD
jgi:hypothetical protein